MSARRHVVHEKRFHCLRAWDKIRITKPELTLGQ
jgi:hypothetical protein